MHGDAPRKSVLVVDDHEITLDTLARLLRGEGYEVHTALHCREALRVALQYGCDVLVSDLLLPDGHGADLLRAVRAYRPVHAVAITGDLDASSQCKAHRAGFQVLLHKPLTFATLADAVSRARQAEPPA